MTSISTDKNEIKLYYSSESSVGKQTYAYLSASNKDILAIDITKTNVTGTQWKYIAEQLNLSSGDLVNQEHTNFTRKIDKSNEISETDWIKILNKQPEVLTYPIAIIGKRYYQIKNPSDVEKYLEANSEGIEPQNP